MCRRREGRYIRREDAIGPLDQYHPRRRRVDVVELLSQGVNGYLFQRTGQLDTGWAGTNHHERQPPFGIVGIGIGLFKGPEDLCSHR